MKKKRIINDIILIVVLVLIPAIMLVCGNTGQKADNASSLTITIDGSLYIALPLYEDTILTIPSETGFNIVVIENSQAWISEADCPNRVCVDHSPISKNGEQIVCLPHKLVLEITSNEDDEIDSISR